jgi:sporulation protein YlmC with PRC-barrel domain
MKKIIPIIVVSLMSVSLISISNAADVEGKQKELVEKQQEINETKQELKQETKKEMVEQVKEVNQSMQQISRASKIIGTDVKDSYGEKLGDIKELVINPETGQVVYAVVSYGGAFGLGDKLFAVPWNALHWTQDKGHYVLNVDKATLKKAPGFDKNHWPDSASKWDQQREEIEQFYRVTP